MTYCSSICLISALKLLMSRSFRCLARRGLSSGSSSSSSCDASKFAFLDCGGSVRMRSVDVSTDNDVRLE